MHFNIERTKLAASVQNLITAVPVKTITPILINFLIESDHDKQEVVFTATDLDLTLIAKMECNVSESGKIAVSAKSLLEIINSLEDKPVEFRTEDGYLNIHCSNADFSLLCADHIQFPAVPDIDFSNAFTLPAEMFAKMISIAGIAVSDETTRPIFTGLLWRITPDTQIMASTDGKKISEVRKVHQFNIEEKIEVVVPPKGLNFLEKVINDSNQEIKVIFESNRVLFSYQNFVVLSQTISGRYPEYEKALKADNPHHLTIKKALLRQAVRRVALLATDEYHKVKFTINDSKITISSISFEMGNATEEITDFEYSGPEFAIAFNFKFLLSLINVIDTETVKLTFSPPELGFVNNQVLLYNHPDLEDYQVTILLMPLRLK